MKNISESLRTNFPILSIVGPTCSGKTALAIAIARRTPVEIISADSRQIYKLLDIGTAKPPQHILEEIPHHFMNILDPGEAYSAGQFGHAAAVTIAEIFSRDKTPLIVGGSGLYLRALIDGLHHAPGHDENIRAELFARLETEGIDVLFAELQQCDPITAAQFMTKHNRRIVRALEVYLATGIPISTWRAEQAGRGFAARQIALRWERAALYAHINERVDEMMRMGLLEEVQMLQSRGYNDASPGLNTPGYKELFAHLRGECSLERAVQLIKQHTRNYAKRQMTWFSADTRIQWIAIDEHSRIDDIANDLIVQLSETE